MSRPVDSPARRSQPTLKTIAQMTGLAVTTVSRALNDAPDIGQATKEKVRGVAKSIGYRPNRAGVRLRTGKTNVIALVLSSQQDVIGHAAQLVYAISDELKGTPYHLVVMPYAPDTDPLIPVRYVIETHSADGIIFNQTMLNDERVRLLTQENFPFSSHGRTEMGISHSYVDYDNGAYADLIVRELVRRGRKNLVLVPPPLIQSYAHHMAEAFRQTCAALGIKGAILSEFSADHDIDDIRAGTFAALQADSSIDGIISATTAATIASVDAAESSGRRLGHDIDIGSKEVSNLLRVFRRQLVLVREDTTEAGRHLARALLQQINEPDAPLVCNLSVPTAADILPGTPNG
ncbi:LacI family transcriptional regulator [Abyssibius alkaniclasticus]|uniref:LacI family transcriptional regulator n=1 Tax=Abyssibius alkaniclasticus TaxID=2881234 RepID=UPI002363E73D|nr:LacI family transcriptional regulator [Abyssibius alkaniclasticus]UPH69794.1 LacI family transcriptional regulator [Abyssibius alkaniclasticus]